LYGPGLMLLDYNLGILYILAMSSLATYGILLAGCHPFNLNIRIPNYANISINLFFKLAIRSIVFIFVLLLLLYIYSFNILAFCLDYELLNNNLYCYESLLLANRLNKKEYSYYKNHLTRFKHTSSKGDLENIKGLDYIKPLHDSLIKELYIDRSAPVIPFDRNLILDTLYNCYDKDIKYELLKRWGSKPCIYLIEYKYDPLVYYIGRTNLFKRRFHNHLKAE